MGGRLPGTMAFLTVLGAFSFGSVHGQVGAADAHMAAVAGTRSARRLWTSVRSNPAAHLEGSHLRFDVSRPYSISTLRRGSIAGGFKVRSLGVAGGMVFEGLEGYSQLRMSMALSRTFSTGGRNIALGVQPTWGVPVASTQPGAVEIGLTAGWIVDLDGRTRMGMLVTFPGISGSGWSENATRSTVMGLAYSPHEAVTILVDVQDDRRQRAGVRVGTAIRAASVLTVSFGAAPVWNVTSAGVAIDLSSVDVSISGVRHRYLGWTPFIGVGI